MLGTKLLHIVARGKHQVELQALGKRGASRVVLSQRRKVMRQVQVNLRVTGRLGGGFRRESSSASACLPSR